MEGGPQTSKHFASSTVTTFKKQVFVESTRAADKPAEQGGIVSKASAGAWFLDCLGAQCLPAAIQEVEITKGLF